MALVAIGGTEDKGSRNVLINSFPLVSVRHSPFLHSQKQRAHSWKRKRKRKRKICEKIGS